MLNKASMKGSKWRSVSDSHIRVFDIGVLHRQRFDLCIKSTRVVHGNTCALCSTSWNMSVRDCSVFCQHVGRLTFTNSSCDVLDTLFAEGCTCAEDPVERAGPCLTSLCAPAQVDAFVSAESARCGTNPSFGIVSDAIPQRRHLESFYPEPQGVDHDVTPAAHDSDGKIVKIDIGARLTTLSFALGTITALALAALLLQILKRLPTETVQTPTIRRSVQPEAWLRIRMCRRPRYEGI
ncbi:hypothetical protein C8Q78DRAFT_411934 [Trametes maxima]|nr:hypothetical protein C8Q78DRAFT_411934 [Trametes maxima]